MTAAIMELLGKSGRCDVKSLAATVLRLAEKLGALRYAPRVEVARVLGALASAAHQLVRRMEDVEVGLDAACSSARSGSEDLLKGRDAAGVVRGVLDDLAAVKPLLQTLSSGGAAGAPPEPGSVQRVRRMSSEEFLQTLTGATTSPVVGLDFYATREGCDVTVRLHKNLRVTRTPWLLLGLLVHFATTSRDLSKSRQGWMDRRVILKLMNSLFQGRTTLHSLDMDITRLRSLLQDAGLEPRIIQTYGCWVRVDIQPDPAAGRGRTDPLVRTFLSIIVQNLIEPAGDAGDSTPAKPRASLRPPARKELPL